MHNSIFEPDGPEDNPKKQPTSRRTGINWKWIVVGTILSVVVFLYNIVSRENERDRTQIDYERERDFRAACGAGNSDVVKSQLPMASELRQGSNWEHFKAYEQVHVCLMEASERGNVEVVRLLLASGADVKQLMKPSTDGQTPLMVSGANAGVTRLLLSAGVNVNAKTSSGNTALLMFATHLAHLEGDPEALTELIKAGANVNDKDPLGRTALDIFREIQRQSSFSDPNSPKVRKYKMVETALLDAGVR